MSGEQETSQGAADPLINATIGNYKVTRKIGEGGMGSVYLAEHPLIGKKVALKVLHPEFASNQDVVTRFFNEAKAVNDIDHPNIVDIIDYGTIPSPTGNMVYFIMEHLDGHPLENVIAEQAPLSPERSLHICAQVADALAASHRANIVHRDLKPDNIILVKHRSTNDFVKLLDFGIAKLTGDQPGSSRTRTGIVMGTPSYMSPEQCEGRGNIDHRTDIYALGVVLYQMITGRVPFEGQGYGEVLVQHLTQAPAPPSTIRGVIPPHVEAVCMKALEKSPAARYQSMEDFIAALTDPVGFVEANGGLAGFYSANLGSPVLPPSTRAPTHGGQVPLTPAPGSLTPVNAASTQFPSGIHQPKSKMPLFIGGGVVVAAGIAAALMLGGGGDAKKQEVAEAPVQPAVEAQEPAAKVEAEPVQPVQPEVTPPETEAQPEVKAVSVSAAITSAPKGAEIWVNGNFEGKTPAKLRYESDELPLEIVLKKSGYEDLSFSWEFNSEQAKQRYNFSQPMSKAARVSSHSKSDPKTTGTTETTSGTKTKPLIEAGLAVPTLDKPKKQPKDKQGDNMMMPDL